MRIAKLILVVLLAVLAISLYGDDKKADFSGIWNVNEGKSTLDDMGLAFLPYKLEIAQKDNELTVKRSFSSEFEDDFTVEEKLTLDGKECNSEFRGSPRVSTAKWSEDGKSLTIVTNITFERDGEKFEIKTTEILCNNEGILSLNHTSESSWGERKVTLVFDKEEAKKEEANK